MPEQIPTGPQQEIQSDSPTPAISEGLPQQDAQPQAQPQPQAQSAPAALAATPAAPSKPGSFFHNISHAFMGAVLGQAVDDGKRVGGIGGETMAVTDPATGQYSIHPRPMSVSQRMAGLSSRILSGLASVPDSAENPSPIKGLGQGFVAAQKAKSDIVDKERSQESENFKTEQEQKMQKFDIAYKNAATLRLGMETIKMRNDLNPMIPESRATMEAVKSSPELAGLQVQEVNDQQRQDMMKDGHFTGSMILPLGSVPVNDPQTGEPLMNPDGSPRTEQRWGIIGGDPKLMKNGKFVIPSTIADEIKQFGPKAIGPSAASFTAGTEIPLGQFTKIMGAVDNERAKVVAGWNVPTIGVASDGKTPMFINSYDSSQPARPVTYLTPAFNKEQAQTEEEKAKAFKERADGQQALATAAMYGAGLGGGINPQAQPDLFKTLHDGMAAAIAQMPPERRAAAVSISHAVPPQIFSSLLTVANADADFTKTFPSSPRKGVPTLPAQQAVMYLKLLNPQWSEGLYKEKQAALVDYGTGKDGQAIGSFNRFLSHAAEAVHVSDELQRSGSPLWNTPMLEIKNRMMGQPGVPALMASLVAPREEWQSFLRNGHASDMAGNEEAKKIMDDSSTPAQVYQALQVMAGQGIARLDTLNEGWSRQWGGYYPGLVTPAGARAAQQLGLGKDISQYLVGGTVGGVYSTAPNTGRPQGGQAPRATASGPNGQIYTDDGGKTWFDSKTNQPFTPPQQGQR